MTDIHRRVTGATRIKPMAKQTEYTLHKERNPNVVRIDCSSFKTKSNGSTSEYTLLVK